MNFQASKCAVLSNSLHIALPLDYTFYLDSSEEEREEADG